VSRQLFQVAYGGPSDSHSMDVQDLGPALLAFGRLVREANADINGKKSTVKVIVTSDFEHKCFNINFEVVQSVVHQIATFLQSDTIKSAKEILVDLGVISGGSGLGLLGFLKWKKEKKVEAVTDSDKKGVVIVQIGNGNTAEVLADAVRLAENPRIRTALEGTLAPLGADGASKVTFKESDSSAGETLDEEDARVVLAAFSPPQLSASIPDSTPDVVTAWLRVYSPVYDLKADKWRFLYGDHAIYADISETSIARDAIARGGALINDLYKVKMEVVQHLTDGGNLRLEYKILSVVDFQPAFQQISLPLPPSDLV